MNEQFGLTDIFKSLDFHHGFILIKATIVLKTMPFNLFSAN